MSPQNDSVFLLKIGDTLNSPGNTLTVQAMKSNRTYGFPPNGRQKGITDKLQTNDARVLGAYLEGNEIQFVSTTVDTAIGADAIYHGIISNYASAPSVQASYISVDTMDFAYPNISFAGNNGGLNASIISFDYSGVNHYPGVAAVLWDGSGHSPLLEIKQGVAPIKMLLDSIQRWGDYTGSQPRWNALGYVWTVGQFGKTGKQYNNWMSLLRSPYAVSVQNPTPTSSAATLFPIPSFQFIRLRFRLGEEANLRFAIYDMKGALIDQVLEAHCERGENEFQFNTASLPTGQYLLRGISGDGEMMINKTFTKQ
jgi:hypothetical protein